MRSGAERWEGDARLRLALRRLALDAPSADGLLAAVREAAARATVRRRALATSMAAITVISVAVAVSANGSTDPGGPELVLGASDPPVPSDAGSAMTETPSPAETEGRAAGTAEVPGPSDTYHGRAVSPDGRPIAGLYLHGFRYLGDKPVYAWPPVYEGVRTADDGTFELPCQDGYVVTADDDGGWDSPRLSAVMLLPALGASGPLAAPSGTWWAKTSPNWRPTFVGGGTFREDEMHPVRCASAVETTVVPPGAVLEGELRVPAHCPTRTWMVSTQHLVGSLGGGTMVFYSTPIPPGGRFRVTSLFPGPYVVHANTFEETGPVWAADNRRIVVTGPRTYAFDIVVDDDCGASSAQHPTVPTATDPTPGPTPQATASLEPTPTPEPEAS